MSVPALTNALPDALASLARRYGHVAFTGAVSEPGLAGAMRTKMARRR